MNRTSSRTGLFLMELILAVLFFSLAGAVCVRLFVNSHLISQKSVELNHGVLWSQNVAESFYACEGDFAKMVSLFPEGEVDAAESGNKQLTLCFDADFSPIAVAGNAPYRLTASVGSEQEHLLTCRIVMRRTADNSVIYELSPTLFTAKEAAYD